MLGEKIAESTGKVTARRVLPNLGGGPKMETSFEATGKLLGTDITEIGTYVAVLRPDGFLYGEGQGISMGKKSESATWTGQGVGTLRDDGGVSYRGSLYFQSTSPGWTRLNGVACNFEYEVDAKGNSRAQLWEWK